MTSSNSVAFDIEQGLIELPGTPTRWIWAFTCPMPKCACRVAVVLSTSGNREMLLEDGRSVADAWLAKANYRQAAQNLRGVTRFAVDLDTLELFHAVSDAPLGAGAEPGVLEVAQSFDDNVMDAIARVWHRGKGKAPPPELGTGGAKIEVEGWRPGDLVAWDDTRPSLRRDAYVFGRRIFAAVELYCVEPDCDCGDIIVEFRAVVPRGAPDAGHVAFDGESATLHPEHERQRERLNELWAAYCTRHPRHQERFVQRSAAMHDLAGRVIAAPPKLKVGRNQPCPCGSGKRPKNCCGAT